MKNKYIHIITEEQILNCLNTGVDVEVWVNGEFDKVGKITSNASFILKIGMEYYFKNQCSLYALNNYLKLED
ncbi:hypothetical protein [Paenibacillus ihuae]|uniref:hypothetical protein n=1 Tax=Paenibacillus ihuae TaxID=1232431 RepID=UPI0006D555FC|nr:hypothetical protein [Paenibacillus ihuae]